MALATAACVGNVTPDTRGGTSSDSDSIETVVMVVDTTTAVNTTLVSLSPQQVDSLFFRLTHHYSENFNFVVKADSLTLLPREGDLMMDTCRVYRHDIIAVAAIKTLPGDTIDSIWVKVASNQLTMGWIPERELLRGATPDDSISEMLYALTNSRAIWMSAIVALGFLTLLVGRKQRKGEPFAQRIKTLDYKRLNVDVLKQGLKKSLKFNELRSLYPSLFLILVGTMASLYATIQNFVPEFWQEFYFHPTLNPLVLPPMMAALVVIMWLVVITFIAVVDEVYNHLYILPGIAYLMELLGLAMLVYLLISWTTLFYVGYPLLVLLLWKLLQHLYRLWKAGPQNE